MGDSGLQPDHPQSRCSGVMESWHFHRVAWPPSSCPFAATWWLMVSGGTGLLTRRTLGRNQGFSPSPALGRSSFSASLHSPRPPGRPVWAPYHGVPCHPVLHLPPFGPDSATDPMS